MGIDWGQSEAAAVGVFAAWGALVLAVVAIVASWRKQRDADGPNHSGEAAGQPLGVRGKWLTAVILVLIVAVGAYLRLDGLDSKTITHPEVYVPGIDLPRGIAEPPPRHTLGELVWWHFHDEPHPQGYYFLMWVWTATFGTDLYMMRLPSVLFGVGSIVLIYRLASFVLDRVVGLVSAAFLAFHGFHIYWSQNARMYSMACFLGLLSTLLMIQLQRRAAREPWREALYVLTCWLGVMTQLFFWPLLAAQILWTMASRPRGQSGVPRLIVLQSLVVSLGAPLWAHAVYRSHKSPLARLSPEFVEQYLSFGFLYSRDTWSIPARNLPWLASAGLFLLAVALLACSIWKNRSGPRTFQGAAGTRRREGWLAAAGGMLIVAAMAVLAHRRSLPMLGGLAVPVLALCMGWFLMRFWPYVVQISTNLANRVPALRGLISPFFFLAFIPVVTLTLISYKFPLLGSRLVLLFIPYLLILLADGAVWLGRRPLAAAILAAVMGVSFVGSALYYRDYPSSVRDYHDLAVELKKHLDRHDMIFVRRESWIHTPLYYYLDASKHRFIAVNYEHEVQAAPAAGVWVISFGNHPGKPTRWMLPALIDYKVTRHVSSRRMHAQKYVRSSAQVGSGANAKVVLSAH